MVTCYGCGGGGRVSEGIFGMRECGNCYGSGQVTVGAERWRADGLSQPYYSRSAQPSLQVIDPEHDSQVTDPGNNSQIAQPVDNSQAWFDGQTIWLTDSLLVGIMLRDGRLTLRNHAATTNMVVETVNEKTCYLKVPQVSEKAYICTGDGGAFYAKEDKGNAQEFYIQRIGKGFLLCLKDGDIAVFDGNYDVSIGRWEKGRSTVQIWVHLDVMAIWQYSLSVSGRISL